MVDKKSAGHVIGSWAFLIGVVLAVVLGTGLITTQPAWLIVLVIIGLIIGLINVAHKEAKSFLWSSVALIIIGALGQSAVSSVRVFVGILDALLAIFVPAAIIVAIKNVFTIAKGN